MHLLYLDSAGSVADPGHKHFILAGVSVLGAKPIGFKWDWSAWLNDWPSILVIQRRSVWNFMGIRYEKATAGGERWGRRNVARL